MSINFLLFYEFFKIGLFALGGGLATLPFLYDLASRYTWFDASILPNMIAISESTPGPIGVNMATFSGFHSSGILGGIIATLGLVTPSIIIIIVLAKFLNSFNENLYVKSAFYGLRPVVTALIALSAYEVIKSSLINFPAFNLSHQFSDLFFGVPTLLFIGFFILTQLFNKAHPIIFLLIGALIGIILKI